jgi:hypothetical protein
LKRGGGFRLGPVPYDRIKPRILQADTARASFGKEICMKKPDDEVAETILRQIREAKLLSEDAIEKIGQSLSRGELRAEDWRLIVETDRSRREDEDASKGQ